MRRNRRAQATVAATVFFFAFVVVAQDAAEETEEMVELEEFVATGSLLPSSGAAYEARSVPIQVIEREAFDAAGFATAEEFLQKLPVNNGGAIPMQNNQTGFTPGASSASLRGLGADSTLVLVNGKRLAPWPTGAGGSTAFVDLNSIPAAAIRRIEVLKDGASATYGADAVAGVINIITDSDYEGAEWTTRYGNDFSGTDSSEFYNSLVYGIGGKRGNLSGNVFYLKKNSIFHANRKFSATPPFLSSNSIPMNMQLSAEAVREALQLGPMELIPGLDDVGVPSDQNRLIIVTSAPSNPDGTRTAGANVENNDGNLSAGEYTFLDGFGNHSRYNFNRLAQSTPEIERLGSYVQFKQKLSGRLSAYGDANYVGTEAFNTLAPTATGNFRNLDGVSIVIPARTSSPINLPASNAKGKAANGYNRHVDPATGKEFFRRREQPRDAYNPYNPFNQDIEGSSRIRLEEFGIRTEETNADAYHTTWGIQGEDVEVGNSAWGFDVGFRLSRVEELSLLRRVSISRLNRLINAADPWFDPSSNEFLGATNPYNPFGASQFDGYWNENNRALAGHATTVLKNSAKSEVLFGYANVSSSDLYELPGGDIGLALGYDWRRESIRQSPDVLFATGDLAGESTRTATNADRSIQAFFFEAFVPILGPEMNLGVYSWDVNLSGRFEDFITSDRSTFVPKISSRLAFNRQIALRGSWGEGFREPSLFELFAGKTAGQAAISNPFNPEDNNPEINITTAGNPNLEAEESESYNLGIVYSPQFLKGFTTSLDYWQIERRGSVANNPQDTVDRIFGGGSVFPGESVQRDAQNNLLLVETVFQNSGFSRFRGIDIAAGYVLPTDRFGIFHWDFNFTWLLEALRQDNPNRPIFDYVGFGTATNFELRESPDEVKESDLAIGSQSGKPLVIANVGSNSDGYLEYKFTASLGWTYKNLDMHLFGRYTSGFADVNSDFQLTEVDDRFLWDAQASYNIFADKSGWFANTAFTIGIENLFDTDPPAVFADYQTGDGYPGSLYEPDGRRYYLSFKKTF